MKNLYIFDCFGVVVSDVSTLFLNKHLNADEQLYMRKVFRQVDVGAIDMEHMFAELSKLCKTDVNSAKNEWASYEYALTDTLKIIGQLRAQGHCVALLSNANVNYVNYLFDKFDVHRYFDCEFVSSCYGCAKPDKKFYKLCVDSFSERFGAVYFTDDNPKNLIGLEQLGITPILFTSAQDFAQKIGLHQ